MATNFLELATTLENVGARWLLEKKVNFVPCKWFLCFYFWAVIWSYIVDLFAALHELASASSRTLLKLASSVRALLKPYGDTLRDIMYAKKKKIPMASYGDLLLNGKQKKPFVLLKSEVTIIH